MSAFAIQPDTLDFELPENLIAQTPEKKRDHARLMVLNRAADTIEHRRFSDLIDYLRAGDVLVVNKARVNKAKLIGKKATGGRVEAIFVRPKADGKWVALMRPLLKDGVAVQFENGLSAVVAGREENGEYRLDCNGADVATVLEKHGTVPLPPYIERKNGNAGHDDESDYQTVYATALGSIAAPTAGLHFTTELLDAIRAKGVRVVEILLNVGWGTFRPIADRVDDHKMLAESYEVSPAAFEEISNAKKEKRRVVAVGTTSTRTLESLDKGLTGDTNLFIKPGFKFKYVDALVTNLHVPRSTPVSLTAAFAGFNLLERAYAEAIAKEYRFFSYGDAMLVL